MFNKKFKKQQPLIIVDDHDVEIPFDKKQIPQQQKQKNIFLSYEDEHHEEIKKYVKIDQKPFQAIKDATNSSNVNYLKDLEEENRMNNYLAQKNMQNISELNIIDLENDGIYDTESKLSKKVEITIDETDNNLITDMDNKRMNMLGIVKQQKYFYNENSDDEEFNRLQNSLIKSNRIHYESEDGQGNGHKQYKFNDSVQMNYCSFMDSFSQIDLESIIGNVKSIISQETFKKDRIKQEVDKSNEAIQSSKLLIQNWTTQNQELQTQLREFELSNEFFQCLNSMMKQKIPLLFKFYEEEFDDVIYSYQSLIAARLEEEQLKYESIFEGLPIQILLNYAKDICLLMGDVDEEFLDLNRICENYQTVMFVTPDLKILQPIFDYHVILRFIDLYVSNMQDTESDLFAGIINDSYLLSQLIQQCKLIKGLVQLNPTYPKFNQQFCRLILQYTYKYLKLDHPEEAQNSLVFIKSLLDPILKNVFKKSTIYSEQIVENLRLMSDLIPKDSLDKLIKSYNDQSVQ